MMDGPKQTQSLDGALVVFDLDHTLTQCDTYVAFLLKVLRARPTRLLYGLHLASGVVVHKLGFRDNTWLKTLFLRCICGGCDRRFIETIAEDFAAELVPDRISPAALQSIKQHRMRGDQNVLATASLDIYVYAIAQRLGIASDDVVATRVEWQGDRLTGRLSSANIYGQAKADAVKAWMQLSGRDRVDVAYSDHHSDLPLLGAARQGVAVNPTGRLRDAAGSYRLEIVQWTMHGEA